MRIDLITLFPEMCEAVLSESIIGRARRSGAIEINCHQLRDFAFDKHRRVDDSTYGGGMGMLMLAEPIALCFEHICEEVGEKPHFIYLSPKGKVLTQQKLKELSVHENICLLCGHYEGVDQRVLDMYVDEEISIGDYVLTGGELPALVLTDSLARLQPGVLSDDECFEMESHYDGLLEYPQYTKPKVWRGVDIPEVLFTGHHENIRKWRREQSVIVTAEKRPDMLDKATLTDKERQLAERIISDKNHAEER
ncbi:tRNA (guanosine(37)-N1)-methyltransferase TrmD [uncultured Ruminococcus sp.]|uniref:tRNA (guanosine(37)-N1)-methyltransferase TrmD n=1 Tax=uncultured Ruminococcus sp. TaxID=165186 RepID=UPI00293117C7|nr:tRNA (guanosine(37)-N1)-methyltransferase TrmD [uncultured Ruminococcus sp.]